MKKELFKKMSLCNRAYDFENATVLPVVDVDSIEQPFDMILKEIFSVDDVSGLPKGDIQYFLSKDGNPQVKAWLESNLLQPRREVSANPEGVTDELIAEFARKPTESGFEYAQRIASIRDEALANLNSQHNE